MGYVRRRTTAALALAAATVVGTVAAPAVAAPHRAARHHPTVTVQADDFRFCSSAASFCTPTDSGHVTSVKVGTRVRWVYRDTACDAVVPCPGHDVVSAHFGKPTFVKKDGATIFAMVFNRPGTYSYFCSAHQSFGMTGTVVVHR